MQKGRGFEIDLEGNRSGIKESNDYLGRLGRSKRYGKPTVVRPKRAYLNQAFGPEPVKNNPLIFYSFLPFIFIQFGRQQIPEC